MEFIGFCFYIVFSEVRLLYLFDYSMCIDVVFVVLEVISVFEIIIMMLFFLLRLDCSVIFLFRW